MAAIPLLSLYSLLSNKCPTKKLLQFRDYLRLKRR
jgi:hypothetical protein